MRLPAPPPVPRDELPTVPPPRDPELDALAAELEALRADARRLCRGPVCERCGAPYGEPGIYCGCEMPPSADYEMFWGRV